MPLRQRVSPRERQPLNSDTLLIVITPYDAAYAITTPLFFHAPHEFSLFLLIDIAY